ncbi:hypothetical protein FBEOM_5413 [Fusarium beomiforme]|uniref:2EXR domain-containing protein n=1 Tax=Fusarium beomiforme TaxID=44412 RepID=A0A9P5AL34_9HYPO|nr:hypothetical protein FBEOM_5413 [Fusarium beomiforme]
MASFHTFLQLPTELRLKIWETALHPTYAVPGGIHYITFDYDSTARPISHKMNDILPEHRSAYLWHAGLWLACRESREVVADCWYAETWLRLQHPEHCKCVDRMLSFSLNDCPEPQRALAENNYCRQRLTVRPQGNIFCIVPQDWEIRWYDVSWRFDRVKYDIALEYNSEWNLELLKRGRSTSLNQFLVSLRLFLRIILDFSSSNWLITFPHIRLIGRNAQCDAKFGDNILYDCQQEYIEIDMSPGWMSFRIAPENPLSDLLDHLDRFWGYIKQRIPQGLLHRVNPPDSFRELIHVLVPRRSNTARFV